MNAVFPSLLERQITTSSLLGSWSRMTCMAKGTACIRSHNAGASEPRCEIRLAQLCFERVCAAERKPPDGSECNGQLEAYHRFHPVDVCHTSRVIWTVAPPTAVLTIPTQQNIDSAAMSMADSYVTRMKTSLNERFIGPRTCILLNLSNTP